MSVCVCAYTDTLTLQLLSSTFELWDALTRLFYTSSGLYIYLFHCILLNKHQTLVTKYST